MSIGFKFVYLLSALLFSSCVHAQIMGLRYSLRDNLDNLYLSEQLHLRFKDARSCSLYHVAIGKLRSTNCQLKNVCNDKETIELGTQFDNNANATECCFLAPKEDFGPTAAALVAGKGDAKFAMNGTLSMGLYARENGHKRTSVQLRYEDRSTCEQMFRTIHISENCLLHTDCERKTSIGISSTDSGGWCSFWDFGEADVIGRA